MHNRSRLALVVVEFIFHLVQWWHPHEAPFDDHIYTKFIIVKATVLLELQYRYQRWRYRIPF